MKYFIKKSLIFLLSIYPKFIYKLIDKIEMGFEFLKGIGFGSFSYDDEISSASTFHPDMNVIIDVGANIGEYSNAILEKFDPQELHIFEPSKTNITALRKRYGTKQNVIINGCALSDENKEGTLYSDNPGSGISSLSKRKLEHFNIDFSREEQVNIIRFDEYWLERSKEIDLFKIDVEGHELDVLKGIGDLIISIKIIQFEFGGCNIDSRTYFQDFFYFFKDNNFRIYRITPYKPVLIDRYRERDERFVTTNFLALNNLYFK